MSRLAVVLNPASGLSRRGLAVAEVERLFHEIGLAPEIVPLRAGMELGGFQTVVAAGGDGTVSTVAAALAGTDAALGVLPSGTLNHFAKDLKLPLDLAEAVRVIADGYTIQVDLATVNGHHFINNSSIGLYPTMVQERERRMRRGLPKLLATCLASLTALWRFPNTAVVLGAGETGLATRTAFVFIGNNLYEFTGWEAGTRQSLQQGQLQITTVEKPTRGALLRSAFRTLIGQVDPANPLRTFTATHAHIGTLRRHVKVSLDGEVVRLRSPLEYRIVPGALRVIVPRP